mgnify:CR=1 FL=1
MISTYDLRVEVQNMLARLDENFKWSECTYDYTVFPISAVEAEVGTDNYIITIKKRVTS